MLRSVENHKMWTDFYKQKKEEDCQVTWPLRGLAQAPNLGKCYTLTQWLLLLTVNVDGSGSVDVNSDPPGVVLYQDEVAGPVEGVVDAVQRDDVRVPGRLSWRQSTGR